jgi:crossover junction endodeoxyribonuclease RusA
LISLSLPFPPSSNSIWRNVAGRTLKSAPYRAWLAEAHVLLRAQQPNSLFGSYRLAILAYRPDNRKRDLGNLEKAVSDLLTQAGVIEDDHLADEIRLAWAPQPASKPGRVTVTLEAA